MTDHVPDWAPFDPGAPPELPRGADGDGRVVALVASRTLARAPWTGEAAASLARTWATGGLRVVLADAGLERPTLHEVFGVRNEEGLSDAVLWGASVQRVARPLPRDGFYVVTSGTPVPDGAAVFATERWGQLCVGFREAGVTLVALVPDGAPGWESVVAAATDVFILSERADDVREAASRGGDRVRGVFGPDGPTVEPAPGDEGVDTATPRGDDTQAAGQPVDLVDASWGDAFDPFGEPVPSPEEPENELPERPSDASEVVSAAAPGPLRAAGAPAPEPFPRGAHEPVRRSGTPDAPRPVRRPPPPARSEERGRRWVLIAIAIVVAIIAAAVLGLIDIPGFGSGEAEDAGDSTALQAAPVDATVASATPPVEDAPPLGFSVALGSYQDGVVAARRARALADRVPDVLVLSVPVRLDGTLYHRVLAGPASDSADASRLAGVIARALGADPSRWVLRPTPWAFRLGELPDLETARRRVEVLTDLGIPAYVVAVDYSDGSSRYRVYAGAYADELEAAHLEALLTERGLSTATLSERIGRLPE